MSWRPRRKRAGILRRAVGLLRTHDIWMMGAGLAFYFTLALIPLLLLGTSALGYALGSPQRATAQIFPAIRRVVPGATTAQLEGAVRSLVEGRAIAGWLGILSLLWVSSGAYEAIASTLTALSGIRETRSFLRRKFQAAALMLACGALFLAGLALISVATAIRGFGTRILDFLPGGMAVAHDTVLGAGPPLLVGATFLILYRWAAPLPLPWTPALLGAGLGAILWHLAKQTFGWYLLRIGRQDILYGILGSFIGLLLWVYYTSLIFLLGAVLALACWSDRPAPPKP